MSIASDTPYQSGEDMGENETESVMGKNDRKGNVLVSEIPVWVNPR